MTILKMAPACVLALWLSVAGPALAQEASLVSLPDAMTHALAYDAGLKARGADINAAREGVDQAGARANPTLDVTAENFAGTGPFSGIDSSEITVSYNQMLERGGKRAARRTLARSDVDVARQLRDVHRLDLLHRVQRAYAQVMGRQAHATAAAERVDVADRLLTSVKRRVTAAIDPQSAQYRAEVNLITAQADRDRADRQSAIARGQLASLWGASQVDFAFRTDLLYVISPAAPSQGGPAPDHELRQAIERQAQAAYALERTRTKQDPTISLGLRQFGTGNDVAAIAGLSLPLGIYNRNRGHVGRAREQRLAAELDRIAVERDMARQATSLTQQLNAIRAEATTIETLILPAATEALRLTRDGYERGAFTYLEVLDAERVLAELRTRFVDTLQSYHLTTADLDRVTARHAQPLPGEETLQ